MRPHKAGRVPSRKGSWVSVKMERETKAPSVLHEAGMLPANMMDVDCPSYHL